MKTYIYAKQLDFLRKVVDSRETESSLPSTSKESQDDCDLAQDHDDTQDTQFDVGSETSNRRTPSNSTLFRKKKSTLENKLMQYIDSHTKQPPVIQNQPPETDDMAFFRSLQPNLDTLSPNEKLSFRIDVMQLLTRYTNKQPNQYVHSFTNVTPTPHYQPQQYPVMANFPNSRFDTSRSPSSSYAAVSTGLTTTLLNRNTHNNESSRMTTPESQFSPEETEDSLISQAESVISLFSNQ